MKRRHAAFEGQMMKPEFYKPFDMEQARSGAPFCGDQGEAVRVLLWDRSHPTHPIIAIEERGEQEALAFRIDGSSGARESLGVVKKLVMLPLGLIDGKPVFVGDDFLWPVSGEPRKATADMAGGDWSRCAWPASEKAHPVTTLRHGDMFTTYANSLRERGYESIQADSHGLAAVANAALRHALDTRQVVPHETHEAVLCQLAESMQAAMAATSDRAARDMAVAEAIRQRCRELVGGSHINNLDVAAIITTIK